MAPIQEQSHGIVEEHGLAEAAERRRPDSVHARTIARLRVLWCERRFLFRASAGGLLACTVLALSLPKRYQSTARLMPPDDQSVSGLAMAASLAGRMNGALGSLAGGMLGLKSSGDLFIGILGSRTVEDGIIGKFDLRRVYHQRLWQNARQTLAANTAIFEDRKNGIITISVTDRDPQRAAAIAQEYITELNGVVSQLSTSSARRERIFLEGRLAQVRSDLEQAEKDFGRFASQNATVDLKEQGRVMVGAAATVEGQLIAAQSELEGLKQIYSDQNVRVRALVARISELESQLAQLGGKEQQQEVAGDATHPDGGDLYPSLRKLPLLGVPYADLYRQTRVEEAVFETLTQEYEMAKVAEAKEIPSVKVLDPPNVPEKKSFPPRAAIVELGTFLTFSFSALAVLARARWEEVEAEDPQKILAREVLGTIEAHMPWAAPDGSRLQAMTHRWWLRWEHGNENRNGGNHANGPPSCDDALKR
ncbi:MAG TPA: GNVR domain-containing protein [Candidatus Aquilonibacter sp.]|nr:GNVR domain-containing protein [Candidatus Aquilonibacter sp.]